MRILAALFLIAVSAFAAPPAGAQAGLYPLAGGIGVRVDGATNAPAWQITQPSGAVARFQLEQFQDQGGYGEHDRSIILKTVGNAAVFGFEYGGYYCFADLVVPGGSAVLTAVPQTFEFVNFRFANNSSDACTQAAKSVRAWTGRLTLSADASGDLTLGAVLETFSDLHQMTFRRTLAGYMVLNLTVPQRLSEKQRADEAARRERQAVIDAPPPPAAQGLGAEFEQCYKRRKAIFFDYTYSKARTVKVCVGRPEYSRTTTSDDGHTTIVHYTCAKTSLMSDYEYCSAVSCLSGAQFEKYCTGIGGIAARADGQVRSLWP